MPKLKIDGHRINFHCPGCGHTHQVTTGPNGWTFNGDVERPTFSPSVLLRRGCHNPHHKANHPDTCWCTYNAAHPESPAPFKCGVCHSFVRDGMIQFLGDCTHEFAGQTVPLPEMEG